MPRKKNRSATDIILDLESRVINLERLIANTDNLLKILSWGKKHETENDKRMKINKLKRLRLCTLPTPLMEAQHLSDILGGPRILIKRDDLTGLAMGGNKARPFEFIMTDAKDTGADSLITAGYEGSNWVCNQIAAARKIGMYIILFLLKGSRKFQGNLLLYKP